MPEAYLIRSLAKSAAFRFSVVFVSSIFPSSLKQSIITPVFKKGDKNLKENYRRVSILPILSKIFERFLLKQISNFMEPFSSKQQCCFRKGYITQYLQPFIHA